MKSISGEELLGRAESPLGSGRVGRLGYKVRSKRDGSIVDTNSSGIG
jgi:hypothetical protein